MSSDELSPVEQGSLEGDFAPRHRHDGFDIPFRPDVPSSPDPSFDPAAPFHYDLFSADPCVDAIARLSREPQPGASTNVSPVTAPNDMFSEWVHNEPTFPDPSLGSKVPSELASRPIAETLPAPTTDISLTTDAELVPRPSSSESGKFLNPSMLMTGQDQQPSFPANESDDIDVDNSFYANGHNPAANGGYDSDVDGEYEVVANDGDDSAVNHDNEPAVNDARLTAVPAASLTGELPNPPPTNALTTNFQVEYMDVDNSVWRQNQHDLHGSLPNQPSQPSAQPAPSYNLHNPYSNFPQVEPNVLPQNQQNTYSGNAPRQEYPYTEFADVNTDHLQNGAYHDFDKLDIDDILRNGPNSDQPSTGFGGNMQMQQGSAPSYHVGEYPAPQVSAVTSRFPDAELLRVAQPEIFSVVSAYIDFTEAEVERMAQLWAEKEFPMVNAPNHGFNQSQRLPVHQSNSSNMQGRLTSSVMPINQPYAQPDDGAEDLAMAPTIAEGQEFTDEPSTPLTPGSRRAHFEPSELRERPQHDPDRPWVRINASSSGKNSRSAKINNWDSKQVYKDNCQHPFGDWNGGNYRFRYDRQGELVQTEMTADEIHTFLFNHLRSRGRRLILWLQKTPDGCARRYEKHSSNKCRFKDCTNNLLGYERTIKVGHWRVCFDEYWHTYGPKHDPLVAAGYVHLYCLERFLDFSSICANLDVRADDRVLPLEFDGKWKAALTSEPGALSVAQKFIDACKKRVYATEEIPAYFEHRDYENESRASFLGTLCCAMSRMKFAAESPSKVKRYQELVKAKGPSNAHWQEHLMDLQMYIEARENNNLRLNPGLATTLPKRKRRQQGSSHKRSESQDGQDSEDSSTEVQVGAPSSSRRTSRARSKQAINYAEEDSEMDDMPVSRKRKRRLIEVIEETEEPEEDDEMGDVIEVRPTNRRRRH